MNNQLMRSVSALAFSCALLASAQAAEKLISERVFYVHDPKATSISFNVMIRAGCNDEAGSVCKGLAHYVEHLVLTGQNPEHKGTALRLFNDGDSNGTTSDRRTTFDHSFPANAPDVEARLDKLFAFYAARLQNFEATPEIVERERKIVTQEYHWRMSHNAFMPAVTKSDAFLYGSHPLGQFAGGHPDLIARYTLEEARGFHKQWYKLSNAWFVVSGPIPETMVKPIAEKHLASLDRSPPPPREWLSRSVDLKPDSLTIHTEDARIATPMVNWVKLVPVKSESYLRTSASMLLLYQFLSSKLKTSPHSELVEQKEIAATVGFSVSHKRPGLIELAFEAQPEPGVTHARATEEMRLYLQGIAARGIDEAMLERLKKRRIDSLLREIAEPRTAKNRIFGWLDEEVSYEELKSLPDIYRSINVTEINEMLRAFAAPGREVVRNFFPKATN